MLLVQQAPLKSFHLESGDMDQQELQLAGSQRQFHFAKFAAFVQEVYHVTGRCCKYEILCNLFNFTLFKLHPLF